MNLFLESLQSHKRNFEPCQKINIKKVLQFCALTGFYQLMHRIDIEALALF